MKTRDIPTKVAGMSRRKSDFVKEHQRRSVVGPGSLLIPFWVYVEHYGIG